MKELYIRKGNTEELLYVHAVPNISLDTADFSSDHDVHNFIRKSCTDILSWDGNANKGKFQMREAFIPIKLFCRRNL